MPTVPVTCNKSNISYCLMLLQQQTEIHGQTSLTGHSAAARLAFDRLHSHQGKRNWKQPSSSISAQNMLEMLMQNITHECYCSLYLTCSSSSLHSYVHRSPSIFCKCSLTVNESSGFCSFLVILYHIVLKSSFLAIFSHVHLQFSNAKQLLKLGRYEINDLSPINFVINYKQLHLVM